MKKLTVLSILAASLLLVGCGDSGKAEEAHQAHSEKSAMKCGEGKCGGDKKSAVEQVTDAVAQKAAAATESVKEATSSAMDKVKEAAATATAAVVSATGPNGKALYAKCQGCHGADGKTKAMGKATPLAGQSQADIASKIAGYKAGTRNEVGMGALMKGQVASMSDADVTAISTYISGL